MKRKREIEIICLALEKSGLVISPEIESAVSIGLKTIRAEKFKEREINRQKYYNRNKKTKRLLDR